MAAKAPVRIEGKSTFEQDGIRITVEDDTLHIDIEVPDDVAQLARDRK